MLGVANRTRARDRATSEPRLHWGGGPVCSLPSDARFARVKRGPTLVAAAAAPTRDSVAAATAGDGVNVRAIHDRAPVTLSPWVPAPRLAAALLADVMLALAGLNVLASPPRCARGIAPHGVPSHVLQVRAHAAFGGGGMRRLPRPPPFCRFACTFQRGVAQLRHSQMPAATL